VWRIAERAGIELTAGHAAKGYAATDAGERLCREVCDQYQTWLREERGLAMLRSTP
jgi:hypothetical protein